MLDKMNLIALAKQVANADRNAPTAYSYNGQSYDYATLNETLRNELNEYAGTFAQYRENRNLIFSVIEQTIDEVLPKRLAIAYDQFAEVKQFAQGDKPMFRRKINSRNRAKQFITRVGLAGVYEVFKLAAGSESFEVPTSAIGGAAQIGFEEFLDGRVDFSELIDIVMEGMDDLIYEEIGAALKGALGQLPAKNVVTADDFDAQKFDELLMIASAYGEPTIYCTMEFAIKMLPPEAWRYTEAMKDELYRTGRLALYKGHNIVILPNGFKDESLSEKALDSSYCWIIAAGGDTKPVKVALEGDTLIDEWKNHDWSREIQVYKKVGVVAMLSNNICAYRDLSLSSMTEWHFQDDVHNVVVVDDGGEPGEPDDGGSEGGNEGEQSEP